MIHVIDNQAPKSGQIVKESKKQYLIRWANLNQEWIDKSLFCSAVPKSWFTRIFRSRKRYLLVQR